MVNAERKMQNQEPFGCAETGNSAMKIKSLLSVLLLGLTASAPLPRVQTTLTGDYVEARTASVFCGACHYNGELVTEGRSAVLAWNISKGSWNGVNLAGVRAMAEVNCDRNLSDMTARRSSEIAIDRSATESQARAMTDLIQKTAGDNLGQLVSVRRVSISFHHDAGQYVISGDGFADVTAQALPNNECCTQPHLVWYTPLVPISNRRVGYTEAADYVAGSNGDSWQREDENSAFYGQLSLPRQK
jgi:hypothetical protein